MSDDPVRLAEAERMLRQALQVMSTGGRYQPEEWSLLACLVGEAGLVIQEEQRRNPSFQSSLLNEAVEELRDVTAGFTDVQFLKASRAARRRNPSLFS